jgi:membrane protein implicated in regulation of membrane protease activity
MDDFYKRVALAIAGQILPRQADLDIILKNIKCSFVFSAISAIIFSGAIFMSTLIIYNISVQHGFSATISLLILGSVLLVIALLFLIFARRYLKRAVRDSEKLKLFSQQHPTSNANVVDIIVAFWNGYNSCKTTANPTENFQDANQARPATPNTQDVSYNTEIKS